MSNLQAFKDSMARQAGLIPENMAKGLCVKCSAPFSDENVFTELGWKETKISGLCEKCWDELFKEVDE